MVGEHVGVLFSLLLLFPSNRRHYYQLRGKRGRTCGRFEENEETIQLLSRREGEERSKGKIIIMLLGIPKGPL